MDSSPIFEQTLTPRKPAQSDENDCGSAQRRPNSSEGKKKRVSKKKILAEINELPSRTIVESSPSKLEETLSTGSELNKPSLSPYDPVTNYLSPRPQYLRYKPNRRREIFLHLEKEIELRKDACCDDAQQADSEDSNLADTCASSAASIIPEDIMKQENEECDDYDEEIEEEEEEEEDGSSTVQGLLKFLLLLVVLVLSSSYVCNMNASSVSTWPIKGIEVENVYRSNQNSTFEGDLLKILDKERSFLDHKDRYNNGVNFLIEDVRTTLVKTCVDAEEVTLGANVAEPISANVAMAEAESKGEPVDLCEALQQTCTETGYILDRIIDRSELKMSETGVAPTPSALDTENPEEGEVSSKEIEAGMIELQMAERERSINALSTENLEEVGVSSMEIETERSPHAQSTENLEEVKVAIMDTEAEVVGAQSEIEIEHIAYAVAELWSDKGVLVGLIESNWILKAVVGLTISFLLLGVRFLCKKKVGSHPSQGKMSDPDPLIGTKCDELQVIRDKNEDKSLNMCASFASPRPSVKRPIIEEEDSVSIRSRAPTIELLGEFVVAEVSSSLKRNVVKRTIEFEESTHSVSIEKGHSFLESSSMSSRRLNTTSKKTPALKEDGAGEGNKAASFTSSTPVRRSSRIRNRAVQSP
ncbi:uncharacterized protein LOC116198541 [Punica granatum]|uniref:Uncharacterized protein n=2 Tax=Punica granatum TaxID=22663 RepID=A0A218WZ26_PUNGR|nr:uncharacterized protein LOC116198541 [Punica granatum]OWM77759.1 hypothetical protein CDL15_Pgr012461 [Punica granatum]PKI61422.1 hypothetical protein CRG98_018196 [Punica granatum]